ncbi:Rpn family recombination-promoting nuclease/putative transposase [Phytobacter palmae]|uniref:Rpn family recombination-promoting nuclease/putative transposase n=1 Tax=Phytobacter palmae TaxID=1855371 RepID=A0ABU9V236_9ENTR
MKNTAASTTHDALFKQFLTHKETACDFLTLHLPASLRQLCDLTTLKLESGSFVDEALRATHSDVLYSVKTHHGGGYIYVLIEHQSSPDKLMAFRLMRYAVAAMQRHLDAGNTVLPLVIPMLFYHGRISPYPFSLSWLDMFSQPQHARELYTASFPLVDITIVPDEQIMTHRRVALLELLQKHIRLRDMTLLLDKLVTTLSLGYTTRQQLRAAMHYLLSRGNTPAPGAFLRRLALRSPQHKETLMTIAEQLEELGRRKGFRQGRKEGRHEGRNEGREEGQKSEALRIACEMLRSGMDKAIVQRLTGLSEAELAQFKH